MVFRAKMALGTGICPLQVDNPNRGEIPKAGSWGVGGNRKSPQRRFRIPLIEHGFAGSTFICRKLSLVGSGTKTIQSLAMHPHAWHGLRFCSTWGPAASIFLSWLLLGNIFHFCLFWLSGKSPLLCYKLNCCSPSSVDQALSATKFCIDAYVVWHRHFGQQHCSTQDAFLNRRKSMVHSPQS